VTTREALARLPVTRKSELLQLQKASRPFGGFVATRWGEIQRVFASPGPIYEPEGMRADYWRLARPLFAAGFRPGDLVHNCFAYHFTPAGAMRTAARAPSAHGVPRGIRRDEQRVQAMAGAPTATSARRRS
jgi:phenylacetate-CoA ligase